jgi:hypothetical protein
VDSRGKLFPKGPPDNASALLKTYYRLVEGGFADFGQVADEELEWLQAIHDKHLSFYKEERRMHFGAFALVALAVVLLVPPVLSEERYALPLLAAFGLLLVLLVPYTVVYMRYEEGVRRKMRESVLLENERRLRQERPKEAV